MATVPAISYLGDTNEYIDWCSKWGRPYFHRVATFQGGAIGDTAQRKEFNGVDCFDENAGGTTYTDEILFQGRQVAKVFAPVTSLGSNSFGGVLRSDVSARRGQTIWVQATMYLPSDKTSIEEVSRGSGGWKLLRQRLLNPNHGVGHADLYFNSMTNNADKPLYFNCEAQTQTDLGHSPHNGSTNIGDRAVWDIPYDEWFDIQYAVTHDIGHTGDGRTRLMAWHGDTLIADVGPTQTSDRHSMLADDDEVAWASFCTYINTANNKPGNPNYDPNGPEHGLSEPQTWYLAAFEATSKTPSYTDAQGNPKLPPRVI